MTVAVLVNSAQEATRMVPWGARLAWALQTDLMIVQPVRKSGPPGARQWIELDSQDPNATDESPRLLTAVSMALEPFWYSPRDDDDPDATAASSSTDSSERHRLHVSVRKLAAASPDNALAEEVPKLAIDLLLIPLQEPLPEHHDELKWERHLFHHAPCTTMYLRTLRDIDDVFDNILIPAGGGPHAEVGLQLAVELAKLYNVTITALYVTQDVDEVSQHVGERMLQRIVRRALGKDADDRIRLRVALADHLQDGISNVLPDGYDLVLIGATWEATIRKLLFGTAREDSKGAGRVAAWGAIRAPIPLHNRVRQALERFVESRVPQLDREQRVKLVERVQSSSRWDFDFMALIALSTLIAAMGLARDSAAVVIGAMLVAPLMTPLVGAGLAMVQGNYLLIRNAARAVLFGFCLAFAIGVFVGYLPGVYVTAEMQGRGSPNLLDLSVAFFSGVAASYALSRPNLSSALPGVAIAAALVPPIATAGMSTALGDYRLAVGALLLFLTNIVAIVLGTGLSLRAVGIRDSHRHGTAPSWTRYFLGFILGIAIILAAVESSWSGLERHGVSRNFVQSIQACARKHVEDAEVIDVSTTRENGERRVLVHLKSATLDIDPLIDEVTAMARDRYPNQNVSVQFEITQIVLRKPNR
ncbi:MAG: TIGR00341 family protein [Pirellulaceae bacterium]|nr:TIGR00341 family protein [Planctomycetales bacterium]